MYTVQIFQIYGHTTRFSDFRVIGPSEIRLESDMSDSPDFYISEIRGDRFTDFCVHTAPFSGNRLEKVGRLEKIGQWDHGIKERHLIRIIWDSRVENPVFPIINEVITLTGRFDSSS